MLASHISVPCLCSISELTLAHVHVHAITCTCTCGLYDCVGGHVIRIRFLAGKFSFCLLQLPGLKSISPAMDGCGQHACGGTSIIDPSICHLSLAVALTFDQPSSVVCVQCTLRHIDIDIMSELKGLLWHSSPRGWPY